MSRVSASLPFERLLEGARRKARFGARPACCGLIWPTMVPFKNLMDTKCHKRSLNIRQCPNVDLRPGSFVRDDDVRMPTAYSRTEQASCSGSVPVGHGCRLAAGVGRQYVRKSRAMACLQHTLGGGNDR